MPKISTMKKQKNIINAEHRGNGLTPFAADISGFAAKLLGKRGLIEMKILTSWNSIVGQELALHSLPEKICFKKDARDNGVLHLLVSNGAFAVEIGHLTPLILEKINTFFGYNAVAQIKIIQSTASLNTVVETNFDDNENKKLVSDEQQNYIHKITEDVKNPELKEKLVSLGKQILMHNK